ncbi:MAG: hypothetical protein ACOCTQ_01560 [Planctomycetota bacterium]
MKRLRDGMVCYGMIGVAFLLFTGIIGGDIVRADESRNAWIGDAGHYLTRGDTVVYLLNEEGDDFDITLHRYNWVFEPGTKWNDPSLGLEVSGPDDFTFSTTVTTHEDGATVEIPAEEPGVYRAHVKVHGLNYWHMTTTLPLAVASASDQQPFTATPMVPRRWYFYVPEETEFFTLRTWGHGGRSQREDHGLVLRAPHGQRMGALWDNPNPQVRDGEIIWGRDRDDLEQKLDIVVEPGSEGRFWSLDVLLGDAHLYSNFSFSLDGVPPYLTPAPEMWFSPEDGEKPPRKLYEEVPFVRADLPEDGGEQYPRFKHWMPGSSGGRKDWEPSCALGTNASNHLRTPTTFALWNPEGRELDLALRDYVVRPDQSGASLRLLDSTGTIEEEIDVPEIPFKQTIQFEGVQFFQVDDRERFWAYTYPATPAVLVGDDIGEGWNRFRIESGTRRHWYFKVPEGTSSFDLRLDTDNPDDVVAAYVNAPDRRVARLQASQEQISIDVPDGLDGYIWHISLGVAGTTRYSPPDDRPRHPVISLDLDLRGIPPYLAPSWGQWFDPETKAD